jgi:hypothetical protein
VKTKQSFLNLRQARKVVRAKNLALDDGKVDLDRVQPAGVDGRVDGDDVGPLSTQVIGGFLTAMRRTVIHDPENPRGGSIGFLRHNLSCQGVEGRDARMSFAATEHLGSAHIPSGQVGARPAPLILVLHIEGVPRPGRQRGMSAMANLDAGFLIGGKDIESVACSGAPSQRPAYRSRMGPAFSQNWGSRGKIQLQ